MAYTGFIVKVKELRKHPNADRLQIATFFGNDVVIGLETEIGDLGIYFPSDGQLSEEYCEYNNLVRKKDENGVNVGGYLDPAKRNVVAIRLRGERSDGIYMPIHSLGFTGVDFTAFKEGDKIDVVNGFEICKKYIPRTNKRNNNNNNISSKTRTKKPENSYPYFSQHIDTPQLRFCQNMFKPGDIICLTEKIHGTSSRNANTIEKIYKKNLFDHLFYKKGKVHYTYKYVVGTRRTLVTSNDSGYYGTNAFRLKWGKKFADKLYKGEEVFGEIAGYIDDTDIPIMNTCENNKTHDKDFIRTYGPTTIFSYGCKPGQSRFFIYRMTYTSPEGYVIEYPWDLVKVRAEQMGFETVPELERFIYTTETDFNERIKKWLDIPSTIDPKHVIEGVVIRALNAPTFKVAKEKSFNFKVLEGIIKENANEPDMEEIEEEMI